MRTILPFIGCVLLLVACKKSSDNFIDQLPQETQTGANTFGCFVNGKIFKPGGGLFLEALHLKLPINI